MFWKEVKRMRKGEQADEMGVKNSDRNLVVEEKAVRHDLMCRFRLVLECGGRCAGKHCGGNRRSEGWPSLVGWTIYVWVERCEMEAGLRKNKSNKSKESKKNKNKASNLKSWKNLHLGRSYQTSPHCYRMLKCCLVLKRSIRKVGKNHTTDSQKLQNWLYCFLLHRCQQN